jgi:hypothetical protein
MSAFRRVSGPEAGPGALGILVPPGRRTLVILRPRGLAWDLILAARGEDGGSDTAFEEVNHLEAPAVAQRVFQALEQWAEGGPGRVEMLPSTSLAGYEVRAEVGAFAMVVCRRDPGKPYEPMRFATREEAQDVADAIAAVLCPADRAGQEVYFNTRHFAQTDSRTQKPGFSEKPGF